MTIQHAETELFWGVMHERTKKLHRDRLGNLTPFLAAWPRVKAQEYCDWLNDRGFGPCRVVAVRVIYEVGPDQARTAEDEMTEQELAQRVLAWLAAQHYDVYQEVQFRQYGPIADIVVDVNGWGWVIECKTTFGLHVLGQAHRWQRSGVTRVSVATPAKGSARPVAEMATHICSRFGIGRLLVGSEVAEKHEPRFTRPPRWRRDQDILRVCHEGHRRCASAGSANGGYWTPYRETMDGVREFLTGRDWTPTRVIVAEVKHHYNTSSTARACFVTNLRTIEAEKGWVEYRLNGRRYEFRLRREQP